MATYLVKVSYNTEGIGDLSIDSVPVRKRNFEELVGSIGGSIESFYYAFGNYAVYYISGIPDNTTTEALAMKLNSSGLLTCTNLVPISSGDIEKAKN